MKHIKGSTYDLFSAKKTSRAYDPMLLGVISTEPGIVMHASIDSVTNGNTSPTNDRLLALAGRTLVKVNVENGQINEGDYITSSDIAGVGMKATKAGQVIGQALQSFATTSAATSTGEILVFVKSGYYNGESISDFAGVQLDDTASSTLSKLVLSAFMNGQSSTSTAPTSTSEVLADRIAAGVEIITPQITANGLTIDNISSLNDAINFKSDAIFFGRPYFNNDTAGFAVIAKGQQSVDVTFTNPYLADPIVSASITLDSSNNPAADTAAVGDIFNNNIQYVVTKKSTTGFTIILNKPAIDDTTFSWIALAVKDAKTFGFPSNYTLPSTPPSQPSGGSSGGSTATTTASTTPDQTGSGTATSTASSTPQTASSTPDTVPPVITLNGSNPVNLTVGDSYTDAGATATDDVDGTDTVTSSGTVDTTTAGTYTITYSATDAAGNTATATRTVNVAAASGDSATSTDATSTNP